MFLILQLFAICLFWWSGVYADASAAAAAFADANERSCARLAFSYSWDTGLLQDFLTCAGTCNTYIHNSGFLQHNLPKPPKPVGPQIYSLAALWEAYMKSPDPCHIDDGMCFSRHWSSMFSASATCRCKVMVGLMRVQESGTRNGVTCSVRHVKERFLQIFPKEHFLLDYDELYSDQGIHCHHVRNGNQDTCSCTKTGICDITNHFGWNPPIGD